MRLRYTETDLLNMAEFIVSENATLLEAESVLGFPHASIHWNIYHRLDSIDRELARECKRIIRNHRLKHKNYKSRFVE